MKAGLIPFKKHLGKTIKDNKSDLKKINRNQQIREKKEKKKEILD